MDPDVHDMVASNALVGNLQADNGSEGGIQKGCLVGMVEKAGRRGNMGGSVGRDRTKVPKMGDNHTLVLQHSFLRAAND
jgi:hypothetical protein